MRVPWKLERCILCLESRCGLTDEHLIPECIGGKLKVPLLCGKCNADLGTYLDASILGDPSIVLAARNLQDRIPNIVEPLLERQPHTAHGEGPPVCGRVRDGAFRAFGQRMPDGSFVQQTSDARRSVESILLRQGRDRTLVEKALGKFDAAQENVRVSLDDGLEIVKWVADRIEPALGNKRMDELVPLKIAYEFLALHLYGGTYRSDPPLVEVRLSLQKALAGSEACFVEHLHGSYEPFHGIAVQEARPHVVVQLRLFGWLAFRVHFPRLAFQGPQLAYTHRLDSGTERWARVG